MNDEIVTISVDLVLIYRILAAIFWGCGWAAFIQFNQWGKFLAERRTWVTVVIGVGVDLIIAYPGNWWVVSGVIAFSSLGIIFRSLWNESRDSEINFNAHKLKHGLEDCTALISRLMSEVTRLIEDGNLPQGEIPRVSKILSLCHTLKETFIRARRESAKR